MLLPLISFAQIVPKECLSYGEQVAAMVTADQAMRSQWDMNALVNAKSPPKFVVLTEVVDRQNTRRLRRLTQGEADDGQLEQLAQSCFFLSS